MTVLVLVALGGGVGAGLRWVADTLLARILPRGFPWAILLVNVTGSLGLGLLVGASLGWPWLTVLGTGLLGGYTTFSTVSLDTAVLWQEGRRRTALLDAVGTFALAVAAAAAGLGAGSLIG